MLVLLLEKQRRRMNIHDVIQIWHTVHAAMHCVSSSTAACNALCFSASQARKGRPGPDVWNSNVYLPLPPDMCMCAYCIFQARVVMDQQSHTGTRPHPSSPRSITKARQQVWLSSIDHQNKAAGVRFAPRVTADNRSRET